MARYLGLDTSNYTTSAAIYDAASDTLVQEKKLLPVKEGTLGLRQSDAVFHHTRQLPEIMERLLPDTGAADVSAVGASERPCSESGSYMPCFLVGMGAARQLGAVLHTPVHFFTHQQGHVAAAAYGAGRTDLLSSPLIAFHVSGGTTDVLLVHPHEETVIDCTRVAGSLDLKAGQLIDRVGGMLGLAFPAGIELETCAGEATDADVTAAARPKAVLRDGSCHLSGAENQCADLLARGVPAPIVARFCLLTVYETVAGMTEAARKTYGDLPVLYAGGVMSNKLLHERLEAAFGGVFSPPAFSADNAAGIAWLTAQKEGCSCR